MREEGRNVKEEVEGDPIVGGKDLGRKGGSVSSVSFEVFCGLTGGTE